MGNWGGKRFPQNNQSWFSVFLGEFISPPLAFNALLALHSTVIKINKSYHSYEYILNTELPGIPIPRGKLGVINYKDSNYKE